MITRAGVRIVTVFALAASVAAPGALRAQQALGRYVSQDDCRFRELSVGDYAGYRRRRSDATDRVSPYAVAVLDDAAGTLVQWGRDGARRPAVTLRAAMGAAFTGVARVTSGFGDACAVTATGEMWCWGDNTDNCRGAWEMPQVFPTRFLRTAMGPAFEAVPESVAMGYAAGCATQAPDGVAYCWGYNASGMNGNGTFTVRDVPRPVVDAMGASMRNFRRFTITRSASCAVRNDDTVWCWGSVGHGALIPPIGGPDVPSARQVMLTDGPFTAAVIHSEDANDSDGTPDFPIHICTVRPDGSVWCWGRNTRGALGDGTTTDHATPAPVLEGMSPLRNAMTTRHAIAGTCALLTDGTVRCWGDNQYGQVGDGTTTSRLTATTVIGPDGRPLDNVTQIASLGAFARCALRRDATLWCWGRNLAGELGDGTVTNRPRAAQVTCGECTSSAECALGPDAYSARGFALCDVARSRCVQCMADMDCREAATPLCDTSAMRSVCIGRAANGELPAAGRACAMGTPATSSGCASGVCDADGRCGLTNGSAGCEGMNARCRSNVCGGDGRCGAPLGAACMSDAQCREGICAPDASGMNRCVVCAARNAATVCTGATPVCDPERGACVRCTGDQGTATSATNSAPCPDAATPFCATDGTCGRCATNADCRATGATHGGPICGAMGACGAMCRVDGDCEEGRWCAVASGMTSGMCAPRAANGSPVPSDPGATTPGPCTDGASVRCASGACGTDGVCGRPDGAMCMTRDECRASDCILGVCGGPRVDAAADVAMDDVVSDVSTDDIVDGGANDAAKVGTDAAVDVVADVSPADVSVAMDVASADAGTAKDASAAGDVPSDVATGQPEAGTGTASDKGGCGCRATSPRGGAGVAFVWAMLALVTARRKRR
jgi:MYXO-CTERM domain-containing protein